MGFGPADAQADRVLSFGRGIGERDKRRIGERVRGLAFLAALFGLNDDLARLALVWVQESLHQLAVPHAPDLDRQPVARAAVQDG